MSQFAGQQHEIIVVVGSTVSSIVHHPEILSTVVRCSKGTKQSSNLLWNMYRDVFSLGGLKVGLIRRSSQTVSVNTRKLREASARKQTKHIKKTTSEDL